MATQTSYTTLKVSRFGFSVLSITINRVDTPDARAMACALLAFSTKAQDDDHKFISDKWEESFKYPQQYVSFCIEAGGDARDDFHCSISHYDITENEVREACYENQGVAQHFF